MINTVVFLFMFINKLSFEKQTLVCLLLIRQLYCSEYFCHFISNQISTNLKSNSL